MSLDEELGNLIATLTMSQARPRPASVAELREFVLPLAQIVADTRAALALADRRITQGARTGDSEDEHLRRRCGAIEERVQRHDTRITALEGVEESIDEALGAEPVVTGPLVDGLGMPLAWRVPNPDGPMPRMVGLTDALDDLAAKDRDELARTLTLVEMRDKVIAAQRDQITALEHELAAYKRASEAEPRAAKAAQDEIDRVSEQRDQLSAEVLRITEARMHLAAKLERAELQVARLTDDNKALTAKVFDQGAQLGERAVKMTAVAKTLQRSETDHTQLVDSLEASEQVRMSLAKQLEVTQAQLDRFMGVVGDQAIQIMELRGADRVESAHSTIAELRGRIAALEDKIRETWRRLSEPVMPGIPYWTSPGDGDLADAVSDRDTAWRAALDDKTETLTKERDALREDIKTIGDAHWRGVAEWRAVNGIDVGNELPPTRATLVRWLLTQREELTEQLRVADADRVPLRMDLDEQLAKAKRLEPVLRRLGEWISTGNVVSKTSMMYSVDSNLLAAYQEWEKAEADALNEDVDIPSSDDEPEERAGMHSHGDGVPCYERHIDPNPHHGGGMAGHDDDGAADPGPGSKR